MVVQLPKFGALKSKYNNKYLRYVNENSSKVRTFLQYSGEEILSPFTKFEFEQAQCDSSLYHIKCCYNNKYLISSSSDHHYIVATADEKQEDKSKRTCTLFRPSYESNHQSFRFFHVFLGFHVVLWRVDAPYGECLRAQWTDPDKDLCDLSMVLNLDSMWSLPRYLAFKGDNGSFLRDIMWNNLPYLQFGSNDIEDPTIRMEARMSRDGIIRILSIQLEKFWRHEPSNYILANSSDTTNQNQSTLFSPTRISSTIVALRNLGNGRFVKRFTTSNRESFLYTEKTEIDVHARLHMIELVRLREISNVVFYLSDATIYNQSVIVLATATASNETGAANSVKLNFSYTDTRSSAWSSSVSTKLSDVKTTLRSGVPFIFDGKIIGTSTLFSGEYKWGETITTLLKKTNGLTHEVSIPAMSTITGTLYATKGSCRIPFSYKQYDTLIAGHSVEFFQHDGVYNGTNYYNFRYETKLIPISR